MKMSVWVLVDAQDEPYWEVGTASIFEVGRVWAWKTRDAARPAVKLLRERGMLLKGDKLVRRTL
jgi:hypothetical protein